MPSDRWLGASPPTIDVHYGRASSGKTTVVVAAESLLSWRGLGRCFSSDDGFVLIRLSGALREMLAYCEKLTRCVLIVDQALLETVDPADLTDIVDAELTTPILVVVGQENPGVLERILSMGCAGHLPEQPASTTLRRAVRAVSSGELWASRRLVSTVLRSLRSAERSRKLTDREKEILKLIALGLKNQEIADQLFISRETVRWHVRSLYSKIRVQDRLAAVFYAWEHLADECIAAAATKKPLMAPKPATASLTAAG